MSDKKAPDNFTITKDGQPYDIKMTFGLLNELVRTIGDIEAVAEISFDIELRDEVLNQIFAARDEKGRITEPVNLFTLDVHQDDIVNLLEWVGSHVTDFLLKQLVRTKGVMEAHQDLLTALTPISTGTPGSPSQTPSS